MMKLFKFISAGALMLGAVAVSNAQEDASNKDSMAFSWGVKGGVNFATLNGDDFESPNSRTSFHVGLVAEMPIADIFSLQAEVLYSGQGAERSYSYPTGEILNPVATGDVEFQLDYINVPILAKFYLFKGFSIEAGPQFSFLLNDEIDFQPTADDGDFPSPIRQTANTFEFGVAGGITFQTEMGLFASARYNQGVTDIADDFDAQNSVFQLGIGYKF